MTGTYNTKSAGETISHALLFGGTLRRGDVVALYGDLGSGKTQFVKGVCLAYNITTPVTSPSFVILNRYEGRDKKNDELFVYHFDLYRVKSTAELYDLGYEELLQNNGICLIEWAEMLGGLLPERRYDVRLSLGDNENERLIEISGPDKK
ncbi:MAG: tRNA (adenosine(37)-N6)-threonylcarbamoyltransferase complex ATPase subunit type 1 TsaE [Bacteroidetes bacterium]|nr:tRNA (adenosine(37)-N6)-threonylcarbamoyltransferase complex ATPase subunit type 1 TsaE [Bacteroidota bacterium]